MRILLTFIRIYPFQSAVMVAALLAAGLLEGHRPVDVSAAVDPGDREKCGQARRPQLAPSRLEQVVGGIFQWFGVTPSIGVLLVAIVITIIFKNAMMLVANRQVGYTVARVATDLRLELLRALMVTRWEYYLRQPVGGLANAMATEAYRAARAYLHAVLMVSELFLVIVYLVTACLVSWKVALLALTAGFLVVFVLKRFIRKSRKAGYRQTTLLKSLLALMTDTLQSIKPLKAMARGEVADFLLEKKTHRSEQSAAETGDQQGTFESFSGTDDGCRSGGRHLRRAGVLAHAPCRRHDPGFPAGPDDEPARKGPGALPGSGRVRVGLLVAQGHHR